MADAACAVQDALGPAFAGLGQSDHVKGDYLIGELQALDFIAQHLSGLAVFLNTLAPSLPLHWSADTAAAARMVSLSDLARRLGGSPEAPRDGDPAGAVELFG